MEKEKSAKGILTREWIMESVLIVILTVLTVFMIVSVKNIQGTARVVNYTGIVRGATQRLIKLELEGQANDEMIAYLNDILDGLENGGGTYNLTQLNSMEYQKNLQSVIHYWGHLQKEIDVARVKGPHRSELLRMSEDYFTLADNLVDSAEKYAQEHANKIRWLEFFIITGMTLLLLLLVKQSVNAVKMNRKNRELNKTAYIDIHTGLPNKSKCELVLSQVESVTVPTCCIMFDLNSLKQVNDSLGHLAGDTLILNFSAILRRMIPEKHFLGRYGGDEFVAVITDTTKEKVEKMLQRIQNEILRFNNDSRQIPISFACGYSFSSDYQECTLQVLLEKADHNMYLNKEETKKALNSVESGPSV